MESCPKTFLIACWHLGGGSIVVQYMTCEKRSYKLSIQATTTIVASMNVVVLANIIVSIDIPTNKNNEKCRS
jgi:hypothetical protein